MVCTTHPGNIGASARAMKNMGLTDLALVSPKSFPSDEAIARSAGARDILDNARVFASLPEAVADRQLVIGASARLRTIHWPQMDPKQCAEKISTGGYARTAIVFGREHAGLTNEELEHCHYLLHIPCNPEFRSLNVAAAVQVVAYELFQAAGIVRELDADSTTELANGEEMESFHRHLLKTLHDIGFLHERKSSPKLLRRLRRIFIRAGLEKTDIHILRGILAAIQKRTAGDRQRSHVPPAGDDAKNPEA